MSEDNFLHDDEDEQDEFDLEAELRGERNPQL